MDTRLLKFLFSQVDIETKRFIANHFGIIPKGQTHVSDNVLVEDGYRPEDLAPMTIEHLQMYTASQETKLPELFILTVLKAKREIENLKVKTLPKIEEPIKVEVIINDVKIKPVIKRKGRPAKK